jgi:DNA (cytosine-5)-methyltransferase 1
VVDLFAGCGGMTLGLWEAAREFGCGLTVRLAVDFDPSVLEIYSGNFPTAVTQVGNVCSLFDGELNAPLTPSEQRLVTNLGAVDVLLGGPPCQGHSDLNNHTRRKDPKNALFSRMARAAEVLQPSVVVAENVTAVQWDEGDVVSSARDALVVAGYTVAAEVLDLRRLGVPQTRKRFVLVASRLPHLGPGVLLNEVRSPMGTHPDRTVRWAIGDLMGVDRQSVYDTPSRCTATNAARIQILFENRLFDLPNRHRPTCHRDRDHSYVSMYGRLHWRKPAHTITTGFGSMGQGRYVHPQQRRTLTPHEAARLQTFPDWFDFGAQPRRGVLATAIGNAVPPFLTREIGRKVLPAVLTDAELRGTEEKRSA